MLALIGSAFIVMRVVAVLVVGRPERLLHTSMVTHYLGVAASLTMWLACRWGEHRPRAVYIIELVGLLAVCSLYAVMATGIPQAFRPEMTILLAFGVFLLGHAVHVPSSWRWTALLGATLTVPLLVGAWAILTPMDPRLVAASASARGSVQTSAASIIGIGMASVVTWERAPRCRRQSSGALTAARPRVDEAVWIRAYTRCRPRPSPRRRCPSSDPDCPVN